MLSELLRKFKHSANYNVLAVCQGNVTLRIAIDRPHRAVAPCQVKRLWHTETAMSSELHRKLTPSWKAVQREQAQAQRQARENWQTSKKLSSALPDSEILPVDASWQDQNSSSNIRGKLAPIKPVFTSETSNCCNVGRTTSGHTRDDQGIIDLRANNQSLTRMRGTTSAKPRTLDHGMSKFQLAIQSLTTCPWSCCKSPTCFSRQRPCLQQATTRQLQCNSVDVGLWCREDIYT